MKKKDDEKVTSKNHNENIDAALRFFNDPFNLVF